MDKVINDNASGEIKQRIKHAIYKNGALDVCIEKYAVIDGNFSVISKTTETITEGAHFDSMETCLNGIFDAL